jgi:16S rRNA (uracil1498-N3)-methyltransferase
MRYFYIEPAALQKDPVILEGSEARHMKKVLRLTSGSRICLLDGQGFEYDTVIQQFVDDRVELEVTGKRPGKKESPVHIGVAQALLKEKKMDRLLRHLCELGITGWHPFISERSVPTPGEKRLSTRLERWQKIVKESVKQCRRAKLPQIHDARMFAEILEYGQSYDLNIIFYENESASLSSLIKPDQPAPQNILLILGPEGGFTEGEIEQAGDTGCLIAGLGPRILRAETAAIAACALAQYLFGDMG